jgi:hypothetical protein
MRACGPASPPAANATAGTTRQAIRAEMKYVRFASKRGTVPGFPGAQRDLDHSAHIRVPIRICPGTKILLASLDETKHAGNRR